MVKEKVPTFNLLKVVFPRRVWEETGKGDGNKILWASRPVTRDDELRRKQMLVEVFNYSPEDAAMICGIGTSDRKKKTAFVESVARSILNLSTLRRQEMIDELRSLLHTNGREA